MAHVILFVVCMQLFHFITQRQCFYQSFKRYVRSAGLAWWPLDLRQRIITWICTSVWPFDGDTQKWRTILMPCICIMRWVCGCGLCDLFVRQKIITWICTSVWPCNGDTHKWRTILMPCACTGCLANSFKHCTYCSRVFIFIVCCVWCISQSFCAYIWALIIYFRSWPL